MAADTARQIQLGRYYSAGTARQMLLPMRLHSACWRCNGTRGPTPLTYTGCTTLLAINPTVRLFCLPTALRLGPWVVRIHAPPREHAPPHVHVILGRSAEVVIALGKGEGPPAVLAVHRMRDRDVLRAFRLVQKHQRRLLADWEALHGKTD